MNDGVLQQRNLKQKFAALLRRFRVPEELSERGAARDTHNAQRDIDELFQVTLTPVFIYFGPLVTYTPNVN